MEKDERTKDPVSVTSIQFVALKLACPRCRAPVSLGGWLELTPGEQVAEPCCVCERCGHPAYLALDRATG